MDKTRYVYEMQKRGPKYWFLSPPRRFGKTLMVSTLEAFFQGRRELFEGLAIDTLLPGEWESHPVLRFDMSRFKAEDEEGLKTKFNELFSPLEAVLGIADPAPLPGVRLAALIEAAYRQTGKQVVVLIDEYDAPLLMVLDDRPMLETFRKVLSEFYSPLKSLEEKIRLLFITGVSRFSQLSVLSEPNNLYIISMLPKYAGVCGITEEELLEDLAPDVEELALAQGKTVDQAFDELKNMYDSYHFAKTSSDIYNPFSLIQELDNRELDSYWFGSGTPTSLIRMITGSGLNVIDLEGVGVTSEEFNAPAQDMASVVPFMNQSGYLTVKGYDPVLDAYTLGIPNREVERGLLQALLPRYAHCEDLEGTATINVT